MVDRNEVYAQANDEVCLKYPCPGCIGSDAGVECKENKNRETRFCITRTPIMNPYPPKYDG